MVMMVRYISLRFIFSTSTIFQKILQKRLSSGISNKLAIESHNLSPSLEDQTESRENLIEVFEYALSEYAKHDQEKLKDLVTAIWKGLTSWEV